MKYTLNSSVSELLKHPVAKDLMDKAVAQMGKNPKLYLNPVTGFMRLAAVDALLESAGKGKIMESVIKVVNASQDVETPECKPADEWWREAVIYQVYPQSFQDSNGDGVGDLKGLISRLDYLSDLGVDAIWLNPIFASPQEDNGYDVADYKQIDPRYGTMQDIEDLIAQSHARGIKVILDLVFNHSSKDHSWFQESLKDHESPYNDYYYWREHSPDEPPNNWTSIFGGSAWKYEPERGAWYLHIFAQGQPDLNWENPRLREALYDVVRFWREKGADGFRLDVISLVSKFQDLSDGNPAIAELAGWLGFENYFHGPRLHEFMKELREKGLGDAYAIGETPALGREINRLISSPARRELSQIFCFDALENPGRSKFDDYKYDLSYAKDTMLGWMKDTEKGIWDALFWENHDNPRMVSKVGCREEHRTALAKLLNFWLLTLRGTPYIYQGQELGLPNTTFASFDEIRDIEAVNTYNAALDKTGSVEDAMAAVQCSSRDHSRMPMPWNADGGFSESYAWIKYHERTPELNVEAQRNDEYSVLNFVKSAIRLRKDFEPLRLGEFEAIADNRRDVFCFYRTCKGQKLYIEMNLTDTEVKPPVGPKNARFLLGNYQDISDTLKAYECRAWMAE